MVFVNIMATRRYSEIKRKLDLGEAVVLTAEEIKKCNMREASEVDVVTTGTRGLMSGTYAVLSIPLKNSKFSRIEKLWLNGITAHPGPCPNENLNIIETMVFGTSFKGSYGAGNLFRDMLEGKPIHIKAIAKNDVQISEDVLFEDIPYAKMFATRNAFRNYSAMINPHDFSVSTIFHALPFSPSFKEVTVSGCGSINPVQNDPVLNTIGIGTKVLINGAEGFVTGTGTRSSTQSPNLTMCADMHTMNPEYVGGFKTSEGPECIMSWAVPIPIISDEVLKRVLIKDSDIALPISDVTTRIPMAYADYGKVWDQTSSTVKVFSDLCENCSVCDVKSACPMDAILDGPLINRGRCFNCGLCSTICPKVFSANLGSMSMQVDSKTYNIPIACRQSDRLRALRISSELKQKLIEKTFTLTEPVEMLHP